MGPFDGPVLGPYGSRSEALGAEAHAGDAADLPLDLRHDLHRHDRLSTGRHGAERPDKRALGIARGLIDRAGRRRRGDQRRSLRDGIAEHDFVGGGAADVADEDLVAGRFADRNLPRPPLLDGDLWRLHSFELHRSGTTLAGRGAGLGIRRWWGRRNHLRIGVAYAADERRRCCEGRSHGGWRCGRQRRSCRRGRREEAGGTSGPKHGWR